MKTTEIEGQSNPNILLILTDQHRLSALGCYGETPCRTPNIDRLAREGVRFSTAYTTCPICSPARATIMTGQYPHRHGMLTNVGNNWCAVHNLPDHPRMLSRRLRARGYRCGYTGKWHLCPGEKQRELFNMPLLPHHLPSTLGFEGQDFPGHGNGGHWYKEFKDYLADRRLCFSKTEKEPDGGADWGVQAGPKEGTVDHFLTDHTIGLVDRFQAAGEPYFIWHNYWGPHAPYLPVEEHFALYRGMPIAPWPNYQIPEGLRRSHHEPNVHPRAGQFGWDYWEDGLRHYYAFATQIDDQIGRLYTHLERSGALDNLIIVFSSDHGETCGSHGGMTDKGHSHFDEIQRIGMIIRYPDRWRPAGIRPGEVRAEPVSLLDCYPTFLDLAGTPEAEMDAPGISMHALLSSRHVPSRDALFVESGGSVVGTTLLTCISGGWKYGFTPGGQDEMYDLNSDPHELTNLIGSSAAHPQRLMLLRKLVEHIGENSFLAKQCLIPRMTAGQ